MTAAGAVVGGATATVAAVSVVPGFEPAVVKGGFGEADVNQRTRWS